MSNVNLFDRLEIRIPRIISFADLLRDKLKVLIFYVSCIKVNYYAISQQKNYARVKKISAGILMYRIKNNKLEFLLAHLGGPIWGKRDAGVWSIPKGEVEENENYLETAKREFEEETGCKAGGELVELGLIVQKSGKTVYAWAVKSDCDLKNFKSNTFKLEWPPKSGEIREFPEIDKIEFFDFETAKEKINPAQIVFLERVSELNKSD